MKAQMLTVPTSAKLNVVSAQQRYDMLVRRYDAMCFLAQKPNAAVKVWGSYEAFRKALLAMHRQVCEAHDILTYLYCKYDLLNGA